MEGDPRWLILPAVSAFLYVVSAICIKQSIVAGAHQSAVNFFVNLLAGIVFQPLWFLAGPVDWSMAWMPAVASITFAIGQVFTFAALRHGDVSLATPLLGVKVIFTVMVASLIFGESLSIKWWIAASAGTLGVIFVTGATLRTLLPRLTRPDALAALLAAGFFAFTDVLVQRWARDFGVPAFMAVMFGGVAVISTVIFPLRDGRHVMNIPPASRVILLFGGGLLGVQALGIGVAIAMTGNAAAANIVYSSRSLWSVVLAWAMAYFLRSSGSGSERGTLGARLGGSLLLIAAMLIVLL
ncbi:MAG: EamA family transporter [Chthoniobacterales bacterium]